MNSGSFYYNYKGFFSIVLLAVVDADYKFLYCDIGASGAGSDAGIFNDTEQKEYLQHALKFSPSSTALILSDAFKHCESCLIWRNSKDEMMQGNPAIRTLDPYSLRTVSVLSTQTRRRSAS